jgi:hypothetical protein
VRCEYTSVLAIRLVIASNQYIPTLGRRIYWTLHFTPPDWISFSLAARRSLSFIAQNFLPNKNDKKTAPNYKKFQTKINIIHH